MSFYVIDTETTGFVKHGGKNEPIQIVAVLYRDGKEAEAHGLGVYFLPEGKITKSAENIHGLSKKDLEERGAKRLDTEWVNTLTDFLDKERDLPIVAHNAEYDRDDVLKPAYRKLGLLDTLPDEERW